MRHPLPPTSAHSNKSRLGFSLIEVIIALVLTGTLLAAIYGAMRMHFYTSAAGQAEGEHLRLVRAIGNKIQLDLRSVVYRREEATTAPSNETTEGEDTEETEETTTVSSVDDSFVGSQTGLIGDNQTLIVHVSRPSKDLNFSLISGQKSNQRSDLQTVAYFMAGKGSGALQNLLSGKEGTGLARMAGDRMILDFADQLGDTSVMAQSSEILSADVIAISFRYFDGQNWYSSWNSTDRNGLPRAVEITLELPAPSRPIIPGQEVEEEENRIYRKVIPILLSKPHDPEMILEDQNSSSLSN